MRTIQCGKGTVWRVGFLVYMSPESYPPPTTDMVFLCNFTVRDIKPHKPRGSWTGSYGNGVASAPCATGPRYYLNKCSYQETVTCHDKTCLKVFSCNTAIAGFSIKKIGLDDFSIFNIDWQHKCRLSWSPELTITQKTAQSMYKLLDKGGRGKSSKRKYERPQLLIWNRF